MNNFKSNRAASFFVVALVYIISSIVGIIIYNSLSFEWWVNLLIADVCATIVTFAFSIALGNASVYDPYWSVQPIVILLGFAFTAEITIHRALLLIAVCIWGIRLTVNWGYTFGGLVHQDWRYTMLKEKTGKFYPIINFTGIHMVPTLIVYGCTLPAAYAFITESDWSIYCLVFFFFSLGSVLLQGTADYQMHRFRKNRTGKFIRDGLWKYSRHPNYLGEIVMWWSVALSVVVVHPDMWVLCIGALANTILFLTVSIPLADERQSKKDGFLQYKKETRMLLPIKK